MTAVVFVRLISYILSPAEGSICCAYFSVFAIITMSIVASLLDQDTRYDGTPIYMRGVEDADDARRACINAGIQIKNCSQCFHIQAFCVLCLCTQCKSVWMYVATMVLSLIGIAYTRRKAQQRELALKERETGYVAFDEYDGVTSKALKRHFEQDNL
jgi:hypothetical protein